MLLKQKRLSPNGLWVFEAAARHLSFTAAARELRSTQSAVSQSVKALEDVLGVRLFERVYRGVRLTDAGVLLQIGVEEGFGRIEQALERIQQQRQQSSLSLMTDFSVASYWLLPRLPRFRREFPDIDVQLLTNHGDVSWRDSAADVAIVFSNEPDQAGRLRLMGEQVFPVCSPSLLQEAQGTSETKLLQQAPLLALSVNAGQRWLDWPAFFQRLGEGRKDPTPALTFDNYTLLIQAAIAGQGIALGWQGLVDDLIAQGFLVEVEGHRVATKLGYDVVDTHPATPTRAKQRFLSWIAGERITP